MVQCYQDLKTDVERNHSFQVFPFSHICKSERAVSSSDTKTNPSSIWWLLEHILCSYEKSSCFARVHGYNLELKLYSGYFSLLGKGFQLFARKTSRSNCWRNWGQFSKSDRTVRGCIYEIFKFNMEFSEILYHWRYSYELAICRNLLGKFLVKRSFMEFRNQLLITFAIRINGLEAKMRARFSAPFCISES